MGNLEAILVFPCENQCVFLIIQIKQGTDISLVKQYPFMLCNIHEANRMVER